MLSKEANYLIPLLTVGFSGIISMKALAMCCTIDRGRMSKSPKIGVAFKTKQEDKCQ